MKTSLLPMIPTYSPTLLPKSEGCRVVARMTVVREVGATMIIEIRDDATFHSFYHIYSQQGRRRSTKQLVRTANRNEGLRPWHAAYRMTPGLEVLESFWKQQPGVMSVKVRFLRKRIYRRLISAAADELGLAQAHAGYATVRPQPVYPIQLPQGYTPMKKRFEILTSR